MAAGVIKRIIVVGAGTIRRAVAANGGGAIMGSPRLRCRDMGSSRLQLMAAVE
jgi:hypothetical protein